jgi:hypothetical protein
MEKDHLLFGKLRTVGSEVFGCILNTMTAIDEQNIDRSIGNAGDRIADEATKESG